MKFLHPQITSASRMEKLNYMDKIPSAHILCNLLVYLRFEREIC